MKHKGFTLVELLIVIVVIGVLSAMMMLSSTEAVSSAKAADIVSNLRNIKTAVLSWYADNLDKVDAKGFITIDSDRRFIQKWTDSELGLSKYLNGEVKLQTKADSTPDNEYFVFAINADNDDRRTWYVGYRTTDSKVREKLRARASSVGLHFSNDWPDNNVEDGKCVWMKIMGDSKPK